MHTARITVILLALALPLSHASAQFVRSVTVKKVHAAPPQANPNFHTDAIAFQVSPVDTTVQEVSGGMTSSFIHTIQNLSQSPISVYFRRTQKLGPGWASSLCWGTSCYTDADDSEVATITPGDSAQLILDVTPGTNDIPDSTVIWLRVGIPGDASDTVLLPFYLSFVPPDPPLVFQWAGTQRFDTTFTGAGEYTISNFLENEYFNSVNYNFTIQDSLPAGWTLTTCSQNIAPTQTSCSTNDSLRVNFDAFGGVTFQQKVKLMVDVPTVTTPDSAIIYLGVHPATGNPADSAVYRFAFTASPLNGISTATGASAGLAVTNAWPNPLHPSSALHLEILTDQTGPATARIYNLDGTLEATLDLGQLSAGSSNLQLAIPDGLPSGEYVIRVGQGNSASEVVRINYVK